MMIYDIPEKKECPVCRKLLPADSYHRDGARKDGLKWCCSICAQTYRGTGKKKRSYDNYEKQCELCKRTLGSNFYIRTNKSKSDDGLESRCTTCRTWANKKSLPSVEEILDYESKLSNTIISVILEMRTVYEAHSDELDGFLKDHRSEFEQRVAVSLSTQKLTKSWKLPAWIHKTSLTGG